MNRIRDMKYLKNYSLPVLTLALAIAGARLQNNCMLYACILAICAMVSLVAFDKVDKRLYPILIFSIGLSLLYQTTLMSNYLMGTDIHGEYYFAQLTYENGWDYSIPKDYNSAASVSMLAPYLAGLLHIPLVWVFKAVFPLAFALVPVILYYLFKTQFSDKVSFLSCFFFMSAPTFFTEITGIGKQMIGEVFLVLLLFLLVRDIKARWKYALIPIFLILATIAHYSMGVLAAIYLTGAVVLLLLIRHLGKAEVDLSLKWLGVGLMLAVVVSGAYLKSVSSGVTFNSLANVVALQVDKIMPDGTVVTDAVTVSAPEATTLLKEPFYLAKQEATVQTALGMDFAKSTPLGKVFRVFQYLTQILIVVGCGWIVWNWRRYKPAYLALFGSAVALLGLTVFLPGFSAFMNATRFYHASLLMLAPALVIGWNFLFKKERLLLVALIPYFLFTSGMVFEATKQADCSSISIPYSHALSANRVGTTGVFTDSDAEVRDYIVEHELSPVYADQWGTVFLIELLGGEPKYLPYDLREVPDDCYLYLTEWNDENGQLVYWWGVGLRKNINYGAEFDDILDGREILYQCGKAKLYGGSY